jgi:protein sidekick
VREWGGRRRPCGLKGASYPPGGNAKSGALGHGEMLSLDESSFPALELNNRRLSVKNSFCRKNGLYTR